MSLRVIQWCTGNVGRYALRQILDHPDLTLAGVYVTSEAKDGKDAGELCGRPKTGVRATRDAEALLASDADCVVYTATADKRPFDAVKDIARILASGKNVVSSSVVGLVHPRALGERVTSQLEEACAKGESSFFTSGIDPGFANDILPLVLSGLCGTWEEIRIQEIINYATYAQPEVLFDTMGFGKPLDAKPIILMPGALGFAWGGTIKLLAEGLGLKLDRIEEWSRAAARDEATRHPGPRDRAGHDGGAALRGARHRRRRAGARRRTRDAHGRRARARLADGQRLVSRAGEGRSRDALRVRVLGRARRSRRRRRGADRDAPRERDPGGLRRAARSALRTRSAAHHRDGDCCADRAQVQVGGPGWCQPPSASASASRGPQLPGS